MDEGYTLSEPITRDLERNIETLCLIAFTKRRS